MKSTHLSTGMKPADIKAELMRKGLSLTDIARAAQAKLAEVSMCIVGSRIYPEIRKVIADRLGWPVEKIFGKHHPQPKAETTAA